MSALGQLDGEVGRWLDTYDRDLDRAFEACRRGDWLIRIAMALGIDRRLVVAAAAEAATIAVRRTAPPDQRPSRSALLAAQFARGEAGAPEAWAAAFAASQAAQELARDQPLASEAALAAAAAGFACDPRADDHYYSQRAYAADAIEHAVRAHGTERAVGAQRCLQAVRDRITIGTLKSAVSRVSSLPPRPRV